MGKKSNSKPVLPKDFENSHPKGFEDSQPEFDYSKVKPEKTSIKISNGKGVFSIVSIIVIIFSIAVLVYIGDKYFSGPSEYEQALDLVYEKYVEEQTACDIRFGSPSSGFLTIDHQMAWNDCMNKAQTRYLDNLDMVDEKFG